MCSRRMEIRGRRKGKGEGEFKYGEGGFEYLIEA